MIRGAPLVTAELIDAMHEALYAGAEPQMLPRPRRLLCPGPLVWQRQAHPDVSRASILARLEANPQGVDYVLSQWQGVVGALSIIDRESLPWWQARMGDSVGADVAPRDAA